MRSFARTSTSWLVIVGLLALAPARINGGQRPAEQLSSADADRFGKKLLDITRYGAQASSQPFLADRTRQTVVTEAETNAYLRFRMTSALPPGMVEPYLNALGGGRVSARAILDLDAVRRASTTRDSFALAQLLTGRLPVTVTGVLRTRSGIATFEMESAAIAGFPIPKPVLQQLVTYYSRSPEYPNGVSLDAQFMLPAGIRQIDIQTRQAVIVQ